MALRYEQELCRRFIRSNWRSPFRIEFVIRETYKVIIIDSFLFELKAFRSLLNKRSSFTKDKDEDKGTRENQDECKRPRDDCA